MQQCQKHCPDMPIAVALPADCVTDIYLTINGQLLRYQLPVPPQPLPTSQSAKSTARCRSSALCNSGAYLWVTARDRRARQGLVIMRQVRTSLALPAVAVPLLTRLSPLLTRVGAAGCLATTGIIHAQLYRHGYQAIPLVGPGFLLLASSCCTVALLLLYTTDALPQLAGAALALGGLAGFVASRTIRCSDLSSTAFNPLRRPCSASWSKLRR
jgi:hypothetical protein